MEVCDLRFLVPNRVLTEGSLRSAGSVSCNQAQGLGALHDLRLESALTLAELRNLRLKATRHAGSKKPVRWGLGQWLRVMSGPRRGTSPRKREIYLLYTCIISCLFEIPIITDDDHRYMRKPMPSTPPHHKKVKKQTFEKTYLETNKQNKTKQSKANQTSKQTNKQTST